MERPRRGLPPGRTTRGNDPPSQVGPSVPEVCVVHHRESPSPATAESVFKKMLFICPRHTNWYLKAIILGQARSTALYIFTHFCPQMNGLRTALSLSPFYKQGEAGHRGWKCFLLFQIEEGPELGFSPEPAPRAGLLPLALTSAVAWPGHGRMKRDIPGLHPPHPCLDNQDRLQTGLRGQRGRMAPWGSHSRVSSWFFFLQPSSLEQRGPQSSSALKDTHDGARASGRRGKRSRETSQTLTRLQNQGFHAHRVPQGHDVLSKTTGQIQTLRELAQDVTRTSEGQFLGDICKRGLR